MARRQLADTGYDVQDRRLPGNSLIDAIFNRRLMSWSDRGGASMLLGDSWADHCRNYLHSIIGDDVHVPGGASHRLRTVLRLDDNPKIEREANLNQLANPDFLLIGEDERGRPVVQAADAKFAADRIKKSQVSIQVVEDLVRVPETGVTRDLLIAAFDSVDAGEVLVLPGIFISPDSPFTDALLARAGRGRQASPDDDIVVRIPVDPSTLFEGADAERLIPTVARLDGLPVSPRQNLLAAVYYLRVSCACFFLWEEQTKPLFDAPSQPEAPEPGLVAAETAKRAMSAQSAYGLLINWHRDLRDVTIARKAVSEAISLPVGMDEIRGRIENDGDSSMNAEVRRVRGTLERIYREKLLAETGPIMADDPRSPNQIVNDIRSRSRELRPELLDELDALTGA
ncbi:MAG: hypothetical protein R3A46_13580 [Thermomicrobiales bacterium]